MKRPEVYISLDIEADGPAPGPYSMLSLGAAAFSVKAGMISGFSINLETLPDAGQDPSTMEWWAGQPKAWAAARLDPVPPKEGMELFDKWLSALHGKLIAVGYPATYDFQYVNYYLHRFLGHNRLGFSALDIKSYAMAVLGREVFTGVTKRNMPKRWFKGCPKHTHLALDDAIGQGVLFLNILKEHTNAQ